jgi:hypothetical protein
MEIATSHHFFVDFKSIDQKLYNRFLKYERIFLDTISVIDDRDIHLTSNDLKNIFNELNKLKSKFQKLNHKIAVFKEELRNNGTLAMVNKDLYDIFQDRSNFEHYNISTVNINTVMNNLNGYIQDVSNRINRMNNLNANNRNYTNRFYRNNNNF